MLNFCIVHYNTPHLTECLVKSINKFVGDKCKIFIFDNSDKSPFVYKQKNIIVIDNTHGGIIDFDKWLNSFPNKTPAAVINGWGSAKHCYTIDKCFDIIQDNFILLDSDVLLLRDVSDLWDDNFIFIGEQGPKDSPSSVKRLFPMCSFINVKYCLEHNIRYFHPNLMHGLNYHQKGDMYDTGASFLEQVRELKHKDIRMSDYILHYKGASWDINSKYNTKIHGSLTPEQWLTLHKEYWSTDTPKNVIYTCITGDYDPIVDPSYIAEGFKYICFTDAPNPTSPVWEFRPIPEELKHLSKVKQQRCIKICPHKYLPEFETSIWIDGNVDVLGDINIFLKEECSDKSKTVFIPTHPQRDCIYTEATKCIELKKDTANNINPQTAQYRKEGFPQQQGLVQTGIIIRRHNDPYCIELMEAWEKELIEHSHRDQLSFNYVLWKLGDKGFKYLDKNLFNSKYFKWYSGHNRNGYQHRIPSSPQPQPAPQRRGNPIYTPLQRGRMNPFRYYRRADRRTVMATPPDTVTHTVKINVTNNVKPEAPAPPPPSPTTNVPLTKNAVKRTDSAGKSVIEVKPSIRRQAGKNRTMATFSGR